MKWILFFGWLGLIFSFSAQQGSDSLELSNRFAIWMKQFFSTFAWIPFDWEFLVRKLAHFGLYFVLGAFAYWVSPEESKNRKRRIFCAFLLCILYAAFDECHQLFVAGRDGKIMDVFLDGAGSFFGILIAYFIKRFLISRKTNL
ncbi:MAG: VanZ family protein [Bacilli bacterium]|nr:VanZ family protein [Bacilli bacterium]